METVKFSAEMDRIMPNGTKLERLATGFIFTEGPVWRQNRLYFTDIPENTIYLWEEGSGVRVYRQPSGNSNGLTMDSQGRLLACEHGNRRVSRMEADGSIIGLAVQYDGKRLNSPNDVVIKKSDGFIYFTDPPYGLSNPNEQELPFQGVYRLDPDSGELSLLIDDLHRPNGLAFSPDERTLYVDDSSNQRVYAFDVTTEGLLRSGRLFAELDAAVGEGVPDGLKVDTEGNVYVTGPGGVWILTPGGDRLGVIKVPEVAANLAWGDEDGRTLFITASASLYRVRLGIPGVTPN